MFQHCELTFWELTFWEFCLRNCLQKQKWRPYKVTGEHICAEVMTNGPLTPLFAIANVVLDLICGTCQEGVELQIEYSCHMCLAWGDKRTIVIDMTYLAPQKSTIFIAACFCGVCYAWIPGKQQSFVIAYLDDTIFIFHLWCVLCMGLQENYSHLLLHIWTDSKKLLSIKCCCVPCMGSQENQSKL